MERFNPYSRWLGFPGVGTQVTVIRKQPHISALGILIFLIQYFNTFLCINCLSLNV